jgi:hypothetical protein
MSIGSIGDPANHLNLDTWVSFRDLQRAGIVPNWQTLRTWQEDPAIQFPRGRLFGPNTRRWNLQREILPWLNSRPVVWPHESTAV